MSTQRFWKTTVRVVVLTDGLLPPLYRNACEVDSDITTGGASGEFEVVEQVEVSRDEMATLLIAQGSDPGFLIEEEVR